MLLFPVSSFSEQVIFPRVLESRNDGVGTMGYEWRAIMHTNFFVHQIYFPSASLGTKGIP